MWERRESTRRKGQFYLFNSETGESMWEVDKSYLVADDVADYSGNNIISNIKDEIEVNVLHLLVKHSLSRRPSSWREDVIIRSEIEAMERIIYLRQQIINDSSSLENLEESFRKYATTESDCSSARNGGDLGFFGGGKMQKEFENEAFSLNVGEMSPIPLKTESGIHIVYRRC